MFCPECGTEVADSAKSCTKCGRSLVRIKHNSSGASGIVKILIFIMVLLLVGGATYAFLSGSRGDDSASSVFNPKGREWVPLDFEAYGIKMEVPGEGWSLRYDAESQIITQDERRATIDINIVGTIALNPDRYRVDNKPEAYSTQKQETITLKGWSGDVLYTIVRGIEFGEVAIKHQLYFRRTFMAANGQEQTYTYLLTFTCPSGMDWHYERVFELIIESIELYDYS